MLTLEGQMDRAVSGPNCEAPVGAVLRVPSYAASPLGGQMSRSENQFPQRFRDFRRTPLVGAVRARHWRTK
jgi:hypothetical protein